MSHQGVEPTFSGFKVIAWSYLFSLIIHILNATAEKTKQIATITDVNHSVAMVTNKEAIRHSVALPWPHPSGEIPSATFVNLLSRWPASELCRKKNRHETINCRRKAIRLMSEVKSPSDKCRYIIGKSTLEYGFPTKIQRARRITVNSDEKPSYSHMHAPMFFRHFSWVNPTSPCTVWAMRYSSKPCNS